MYIKYIILDAARLGVNIINARELNPRFESLFQEKGQSALASVAPHIFLLNTKDKFEEWFFKSGWGDSWGILVYSSEDINTLAKHFRKFVKIKNEVGEEFYFRFYDPRVLRIFLPTCDRRQLEDFFGLVKYFACENENPASGLVYSLHNGDLKIEKIPGNEVISFDP